MKSLGQDYLKHRIFRQLSELTFKRKQLWRNPGFRNFSRKPVVITIPMLLYQLSGASFDLCLVKKPWI